MTIMNMWELCQVEVPQAGQTIILEIINEKIKEFAHRTEIYKLNGNITVVANTVEYTLSTEFPLIDEMKVKSVVFKDSDGEEVNSYYQLKYSITNDKIRFYDYLGGALQEIPSEIATINVTYVAVPATKTISSTLTEIDSQFHEAIRSGVMGRLYKLYPTLQKTFNDNSTAMVKDIALLQLSDAEFERSILRGIRFANSNPLMPKEIFAPSY